MKEAYNGKYTELDSQNLALRSKDEVQSVKCN